MLARSESVSEAIPMMLDKDLMERGTTENPKSSGIRVAPRHKAELQEGKLREMYGLTPAEERLAQLILQGLRLHEAEAALGIRHSTARTHMKRIYAKTGTHRQVELVRLLITGQPFGSPFDDDEDDQ